MYIVMMTEIGSTKVVNFRTPGTGVVVLWYGFVSRIIKCKSFKNLSLYFGA